MALYILHSIFHLARLLYVRPETSVPYYVLYFPKFPCARENFFEIYRQFWHAPSKLFANPDIGSLQRQNLRPYRIPLTLLINTSLLHVSYKDQCNGTRQWASRVHKTRDVCRLTELPPASKKRRTLLHAFR